MGKCCGCDGVGGRSVIAPTGDIGDCCDVVAAVRPRGSPSPLAVLAPAPPEGAVLHAVSTYDAKRRKFGRGVCATWVNAAAYGQLPQPLGSSLAREPSMEKIHVVGKNLSVDILLSSRATPSTRPHGSLARELAPQRLRELPSAAAQSGIETILAVRRNCLRVCCITAIPASAAGDNYSPITRASRCRPGWAGRRCGWRSG